MARRFCQLCGLRPALHRTAWRYCGPCWIEHVRGLYSRPGEFPPACVYSLLRRWRVLELGARAAAGLALFDDLQSYPPFCPVLDRQLRRYKGRHYKFRSAVSRPYWRRRHGLADEAG